MASLEVTAAVGDVWRSQKSVSDWDWDSSPANALREFAHSLSAARKTSTKDGEPARKKQRISEMSEDGADDLGATGGDVVPLAHLSVNLAVSDDDDCFIVEDRPVLTSTPVALRSTDDLKRSGDSKWGSSDNTLMLVGPSGAKSPSIVLKYAQHLPERALRIVDFAQQVGSRQPNKVISSTTWAQCLLLEMWNGTRAEYKLDVRIFWQTGAIAATMHSTVAVQLLPRLMPRSDEESSLRSVPQGSWSPQDFYESVYVPPQDMEIPKAMRLDDLQCNLYPFQKRAVTWLLDREGMKIDGAGNVTPHEKEEESLPGLFEGHADANGMECYVSHLLGEVARTPWSSQSFYTKIKGGILAEEMGLGKTVELIALLALNKRAEPQHDVLDTYTNATVTTSGATLIITPPAILQQWKTELETHAPSLRVMEYKGISGLSDKATIELRQELLEHDVVLATYRVLAGEIHYADEKPQREFRAKKKYIARRSPLVEIQWWRVCLDEAQMVESGVSNAAKVARLVPRCHAWAVTGTPLRKDIEDLLGLLIFLRYEPFCYPKIWSRMIGSHRNIFKSIFNRIALRHTKSKIRDELRLPEQKRIVITVPFTAIEEQHYGTVFQQMCDECGLDPEGAPTHESWNPNAPFVVDAMRRWLTRLRQTCLHPEVGGRNRRALGHRDGPLRTVDEVLQAMIDQNETALRVEERGVIMAKMLQGHIILYGKESRRALEIFQAAILQIDDIVNDSRKQFEEEKEVAAKMKNENSSNNDAESSEDDENASDEKKGRLGVLRQRLRGALEVQHVCYFFTANAYFEIKTASGHAEESDEYQALEKLEAEFYEKAKVIRKELLLEASVKADKLIKAVNERMNGDRSLALPLVPPIRHAVGIESRKIIETVEELRQLLNAQTTQYQEWRQKMVELVTARLLDEENGIEMTGDEYETSTKQQDEQYVYLDALRCIIADRHCLLTGQVNLLINHEMKEALKKAKEGEGHAPELLKEVFAKRSLLIPEEGMSLRGLMSDVRSIITSVRWHEGEKSNRAAAEAAILEGELENLQQISTAQLKAQNRLEKDLDLFRSTMNQRLEFYRQLQQISDAVAPLQEEADEAVDEARVLKEHGKEVEHAAKLATLMTKRRFLFHLRAESTGGEQERTCVICQSPFQNGVLTVCGHQYCKDCIRQWFVQSRNCPMCKRPLKTSDFHAITYKPRELRAQEESNTTTPEGEESSSPSKPTNNSPSKGSIYSSINHDTLAEIQSYDINGSYGTKIDTIARHILWLREHDPGAKSIIFSQYRDFLEVLTRAFSHFRIGCTDIGTKGSIKEFQTDPSIECFLLHAKADSSGLNLVNATHVFLCEPLINAAIELQAIARVHRIGQRRPTTVWMYLVSDTVEETIYDISVTRRLAHMRRSNNATSSKNATRGPSRSGTATPAVSTPMHAQEVEEKTLDAANSMELQQAPFMKLLTKGQSGGEVVEKEDLWHCLFHRPRKSQAMSRELEVEVGRHLRGEAAEERRAAAA